MRISTSSLADVKHIESIVRAEAARAYEIAVSPSQLKELPVDASTEAHNAALQAARRAALRLSDIGQLYRQAEPSDMTPMQRFRTPSPDEEPCGFMWRSASRQAGLRYGSCESIDLRAEVAAGAAGVVGGGTTANTRSRETQPHTAPNLPGGSSCSSEKAR